MPDGNFPPLADPQFGSKLTAEAFDLLAGQHLATLAPNPELVRPEASMPPELRRRKIIAAMVDAIQGATSGAAGGSRELTSDWVLGGGSEHSIEFNDIATLTLDGTSLNLSGVGNVSLSSTGAGPEQGEVEIRADQDLRVVTPGVFEQVATAGSALTLTDPVEGKCEYVAGSYSSIAALKAAPVLVDGGLYSTAGYYSAGDGGHGTYRYSAAAANTADGGVVHAHNSLPGRLILQVSLGVTVTQFGAKGDDVADDATAFNNAAAYCRSAGKHLYIPKPADDSKNYRVTAQLDFRDLVLVHQDFDSFFAAQAIRSEFVGAAILIGNATDIPSFSKYRLKVVRYPYNWASGTIGVSVTRGRGLDLEVNASGFEKGLDVSPANGNYVVYCRFKILELGYNKWNIYIGPTGNGYANANQFFGGSLTLATVDAAIPEANIGIATVSTSMAQDNVFREIDINGTTAAYATLAAAAVFKISPDGNQYGTQGIKCTDCRIENAGAGIRVPLVIVQSTTNKRVVDVEIAVINNDFAEYFPIIPEGETHYIRFVTGSMTRWLNEGNSASAANIARTPTGVDTPLYTDGNTIRGQLRAPGRVIYNVNTNAIISAIDSQSLSGNVANTGLSASGEPDAGVTYNAGGTHYIIGQRYVKNTDKGVWLRVTDLVDQAVVCFNAAGAIISGSAPYYAVGSRFRPQTAGSNGYYQFRGGWLWLHKDVASFILGYQAWLTAGFNPYRDVIVQPLFGANVRPDVTNKTRSVGLVTSGVPKSFWGVGTLFTDISGAARYQNSKDLETTLAANTTFGASTITVTDATGIAAGDVIGWQNGNSAAGMPQWQTAVVASVAGSVVNFAPTTIYANATSGQRVRVNRWTTF